MRETFVSMELVDHLHDPVIEAASQVPTQQQHDAGSASSALIDDQNQVFALTATREQVSASPKKAEAPNVVRLRQKKIPKNSASISVQTEWTWKDMEMLEKYRVQEPEPEELDSDAESVETVSKFVEEPPEEVEPTTTTSLPELPVVASVGPPAILQYHPESKQKLDDFPRTDEEINEEELRELGVHVHGRVPCEFCGKELLPWPSISDQEKLPPSLLFCCTEYREFVEAVLDMQRDENLRLDSKPIDVQPHAKVRSRRARLLAEERAKARLSERNAAEQKRLEEQAQGSGGNTHARTTGNSQPLTASRGVPSTRRSPQLLSATPDSAMAARMKTFTYQLSNLKYVEEGWTLKGPADFEISSDEESEYDEHILIPRDLSSMAIKKAERPLIQRFYKDGTIAAILFSNGTGSIYYPSGNLAISISEVARAMLLHTAFTDQPTHASRQIAQFDPFGNGYCNFTNGSLRLQLTALEGIELNPDGSKRRRWQWWAKANTIFDPHVHAPPCQPILFHLNEEITIKVCSQEKTYMRFSSELVDLKFKVGSRLKVNNVNNLPSTHRSDPYDSYLKKKSTVLTRLLKNIHTEAQNYVKSQEPIRSSQEPTRPAQKTTVVSLSQQNRNKVPMKESLFPPIRQNEEKVQNNRKIYRSVIVT